jgi:predicted XRE-type DNA-binding protein
MLWRAIVTPVAHNPWGPEGERLVGLASQARLPVLERSLVECFRVYRSRQEERERLMVAREIRRLVAVSGLSQREFASYVGTSPSRLSTYATGKVVPSAAMLVRMKGAARMLSERARQIA